MHCEHHIIATVTIVNVVVVMSTLVHATVVLSCWYLFTSDCFALVHWCIAAIGDRTC